MQKLLYSTEIMMKDYYRIVRDWEAKRESLLVYLYDLPKLADFYKNSKEIPYNENPEFKIVNKIPSIRLASTCEAITNCLYSMAELAAQFGNKASKGEIPASFNALRKKLEKKLIDQSLIDKLVDLSWYKKVRELRTEWVHYSSIFIGQHQNEVIMVVKCYRRESDREEFNEKIEVSINEIIEWIKNAISTIDVFSDYLFEKYVIKDFDPNYEFEIPKYNKNGVPIFLENGLLDTHIITVREYFKKIGVIFDE